MAADTSIGAGARRPTTFILRFRRPGRDNPSIRLWIPGPSDTTSRIPCRFALLQPAWAGPDRTETDQSPSVPAGASDAEPIFTSKSGFRVRSRSTASDVALVRHRNRLRKEARAARLSSPSSPISVS